MENFIMEGAFTLGVWTLVFESPNTMLAIQDPNTLLHLPSNIVQVQTEREKAKGRSFLPWCNARLNFHFHEWTGPVADTCDYDSASTSDNKGTNLTVHSELAKPQIKLHVVTVSCTALLQITSPKHHFCNLGPKTSKSNNDPKT